MFSYVLLLAFVKGNINGYDKKHHENLAKTNRDKLGLDADNVKADPTAFANLDGYCKKK